MSNFKEKFLISTGSGLLLCGINSTYTYNFTGLNQNGCPTSAGKLIHILLFLVLSFLTMPELKKNTLLKFKYALYGSLIGFFIFSPELFTVIGTYMNTLSNNCLNNYGLLIHTLLYIVSLTAIMYLPNQ